MATGSELLLTEQQHSDLCRIAQSRSLPAGYVFRAKLILMLAEGASFNAIKRQLQTTAPTIIRWKQRFRQYGLDGLDTYHPGQKPRVLTPALRARILSATRRKPSDGSTHWSCRKLASVLDVSKDAVHRVWKEAGLKPHRLRLLAHLAIWTDIGFSGPSLQELLQRFDHSEPGLRSKLSIADYICLRMAEGMAAMGEEAMETAIGHFDFALSLWEELDDRFLLAIVYFWKGRCLRRRGEYDEALIYTGKGKDLAVALGHMRMAAVMQVLESWLLFQRGQWKEAMRISQAAESALRETDDYVTLGNIQSFYGRMARREGRFDKAIEFFENAIRHYGKRDPRHPNLARSLANMALAKRGIALQLQKRIDRDAQRRRKTSASRLGKPSATSRDSRDQDSRKHDYRGRLAQLRREALEHLEAARAIYQQRPNHHGVGTVYLNAAYIHLDSGDFQRAEEEAASAYDVAEQKQDYILMGRARILQCMIENAKVEEEIGEGADPGSHARPAHQDV